MHENLFLFRPLALDDEAFLWDILYEAIYVPEGSPRPPRAILQEPEIARYAQHWGQPGDFGYTAVSEATGEPVGAAWLRLMTGENRGYGWVSDEIPELTVALLPGYRGLGLGTQLINRVLESAQAHFPAVSLSVTPSNPAAKLYERMGFQRVKEDENSRTMVKTFPKS